LNAQAENAHTHTHTHMHKFQKFKVWTGSQNKTCTSSKLGQSETRKSQQLFYKETKSISLL